MIWLLFLFPIALALIVASEIASIRLANKMMEKSAPEWEKFRGVDYIPPGAPSNVVTLDSARIVRALKARREK